MLGKVLGSEYDVDDRRWDGEEVRVVAPSKVVHVSATG